MNKSSYEKDWTDSRVVEQKTEADRQEFEQSNIFKQIKVKGISDQAFLHCWKRSEHKDLAKSFSCCVWIWKSSAVATRSESDVENSETRYPGIDVSAGAGAYIQCTSDQGQGETGAYLERDQEQAQYSSDRLTRDYEETSRSRSIQGESRRRPSYSLALQACQGSDGQQSESRNGIDFGWTEKKIPAVTTREVGTPQLSLQGRGGAVRLQRRGGGADDLLLGVKYWATIATKQKEISINKALRSWTSEDMDRQLPGWWIRTWSRGSRKEYMDQRRLNQVTQWEMHAQRWKESMEVYIESGWNNNRWWWRICIRSQKIKMDVFFNDDMKGKEELLFNSGMVGELDWIMGLFWRTDWKE